MSKFNFTDEEINKILLSSPMALPNSPNSYGLKGSNIKSFFYDFIRKLMLLLNQHFEMIEGESNLTSNDIRKSITDLINKDIELGDRISAHYSEINSANDNIKVQISADISAHNIDPDAHTHLVGDIQSAKAVAQRALDFAEGKSKIIPVKDVYEMIENLTPYLNVGDKFVLSDKNVPDFTLFEKESENKSATPFTQADLIFGTVEFLPGESYICNGYLLVASESGIDTSLFAKQTDITALEEALNQLDGELEKAVNNLLEALGVKENSINYVSETAETIMLENNTEYDLGLRTSIILQLPEEVTRDFECIITFRSGQTPTAFSSPSEIVFTQDDCWQGVLTPVSNRIYEISIKNVGATLIGKVGSCDYEVQGEIS